MAYVLTLDARDGEPPRVLAGYSYNTLEDAKKWAKRFEADNCHSLPGWTYGIVRL